MHQGCRPFRNRSALALALALAALALRPTPAAAQTYRWDDGGAAANRNWDNPADWFNITGGTDDGVPPLTADVQFGTGYATPVTINLNGNRTVNSLAFGVPAQTTLSGNTLTVSSGLVTVYANQFAGTGSTLPPTGPFVGGSAVILSNLALGAPGVIDARAYVSSTGSPAELVTAGVVSVAGGGGLTKQGGGVWTTGDGAHTFTSLTLAADTSVGFSTVRFGNVGTTAGGSLGLNAGGAADRISWGSHNKLVFTGTAANQVLSKDVQLVFDSPTSGPYVLDTFDNFRGAGPGAGSLTLAGAIGGDLTNGGTSAAREFNVTAGSPTDPNFAVVLGNNANSFRAHVTLASGNLKLTANNALGSAQTLFWFGSGSTGRGVPLDASLLVAAGLTVAQKIETTAYDGTQFVYTLGAAPEFTSGTSTFTGGVQLGVSGPSNGYKGLTLVANGSATVVLAGALTGQAAANNSETSQGAAFRVIKTGTGTVRLTNGFNSYTGDTEVRAGTLQLIDNGALTGASTGTGNTQLASRITVFTGGTLELNNTGTASLTTRINTTRPIDLAGGTLSLVAGNTTLGAVTLRHGAGVILIDPNFGNSTMTLSSLTRPGVGSGMGGTVDFRVIGGVLGQAAKVKITSAPALTNGIIGGWATVSGEGWATYDAVNGVAPLSLYTNFPFAGATSNALVGNGATTDPVTAVNSLKINATAPGGSLNTGGTLAVGTGGVLQTGGQTYTIANALTTATDLAVTTDGTLTLGGAVTAAGLSKSGLGTLVLAAPVTFTGTTAALNLNAGLLRFQGDNRLLGTVAVVNLNSTAAAGIDLNSTTQRLGALNGIGSVSVGSGSLVKTGLQTQVLAGDNPFTGSITVGRGGLRLTGVNAAAGPVTLKRVGDTSILNATLTLAGNGTLVAPSTQPIAIGPGGSLSLVNDDPLHPALANRGDRVADGRPISLAGGTVAFTGATHPAAASSETLGPLTLQAGAATIRSSLHPDLASPGGPAALTFVSLVSRAPGATVNFNHLLNGGTVGAAGGQPRVYFTSGLAAGVLPWAILTGRGTSTAPAYFAAYNTNGLAANGNGVQLLDPAAQVAFASAGAADHALLTDSGSLGGPKTVRTLQINTTATGHSLALGANGLAIGSGGLLKSGDQDYGITGTGTLGQAGTELLVHVYPNASAPLTQPALTIAAPIAADGLTKAGPGTLTLTANNSYAGATTVGAGNLQVLNPITSASDSATGAGPVTVFPGALLLGGNAAGTAGQIAGPVSVGGTLAAGTLPNSPAVLTVRNSVTFSPDRTATFTVLLNGNTAGAEYSQLRVAGGDVVLNGALLSASFGGAPNAPLTLIDVTGGTVSGLFTNSAGQVLPDGAVFATFNGVPWFITYNPTSVVVAPVPEPTGLLVVAAAAASAVGRLRRRARRPGT